MAKRQYLAYGADGSILGVCLTNTDLDQGGQGPFDITSANPANPSAANQRAHLLAANPGAVDIAAYDCACSYGSFCNCIQQAQREKYYDAQNGVYVDKPARTVKVNGVPVDLDANTKTDPLLLPGGVPAVVRLEAAAPDGTSVPYLTLGQLSPAPAEFSMMAGAGEVTITPHTGLDYEFGVKRHKWIIDFAIFIRGT